MVFYYSQTTDDTKFSSHPGLRALIISIGYILALVFAQSPCNPAIALGFWICELMDGDDGKGGKFWVGIALPFGGVVLAWLFFKFWY